MKFRDDIDPAKTYITADHHFGHKNIVGFCHRPDDHEQLMMEHWAQAVPEDGTVLHLGDLVWTGNAWFKNMIAPHLTGERKLLIRGNHDTQRPSFYTQSGFKFVRPFAIKYDGRTISFSHYVWDEEQEGEIPEDLIRIHGHIHNSGYSREAFVPLWRNHINASVEQTRYRPILLKNLLDGYLYGKVGVIAGEMDRIKGGSESEARRGT